MRQHAVHVPHDFPETGTGSLIGRTVARIGAFFTPVFDGLWSVSGMRERRPRITFALHPAYDGARRQGDQLLTLKFTPARKMLSVKACVTAMLSALFGVAGMVGMRCLT